MSNRTAAEWVLIAMAADKKLTLGDIARQMSLSRATLRRRARNGDWRLTEQRKLRKILGIARAECVFDAAQASDSAINLPILADDH